MIRHAAVCPICGAQAWADIDCDFLSWTYECSHNVEEPIWVECFIGAYTFGEAQDEWRKWQWEEALALYEEQKQWPRGYLHRGDDLKWTPADRRKRWQSIKSGKALRGAFDSEIRGLLMESSVLMNRQAYGETIM